MIENINETSIETETSCDNSLANSEIKIIVQ